jgi:hypothetical protein
MPTPTTTKSIGMVLPSRRSHSVRHNHLSFLLRDSCHVIPDS